jgi:hypothetical protein
MTAATPSYRSNIPIPPDATRVGDWEPDAGESYIRMFDGTHRKSDGMCIDVIGVQNIDGSVRRRWVEVGHIGDAREEPAMLEAHEARNFADMVRHETFREHAEAAEDLATKLIAAAEEIERLSCPLCLGSGIVCETDGDIPCVHGAES